MFILSKKKKKNGMFMYALVEVSADFETGKREMVVIEAAVVPNEVKVAAW